MAVSKSLDKSSRVESALIHDQIYRCGSCSLLSLGAEPLTPQDNSGAWRSRSAAGGLKQRCITSDVLQRSGELYPILTAGKSSISRSHRTIHVWLIHKSRYSGSFAMGLPA